MSDARAKKKAVKREKLKSLLNPDSFCPQGTQRLISLDVLRGTAVMCMPLIYDIDAFVNKDYA